MIWLALFMCTIIIPLTVICFWSKTQNSPLITRLSIAIIALLIGTSITRLSSSDTPHTISTQIKKIKNQHDPAIGIPSNEREAVADELNAFLSDLFVVYVKTLNYHWNVTGIVFNDLHIFFKETYQEIFSVIDRVAERVRALGGFSYGSMDSFRENTELSEEGNVGVRHMQMLESLTADVQSLVRIARAIVPVVQNAHDTGSENMLGEVIEMLEKRAWMLRSYIS